MLLNSKSSQEQLSRLFSDLLAVLRWTEVFCSETAYSRRSRCEPFLHTGAPGIDKWLMGVPSQFSLGSLVEREKRKEIPSFMSLLVFFPPKSSHPFSMDRRGGGIGRRTYYAPLVYTWDDV